MTIRRGEQWGAPGALGAHAPVASSDAEAARLVAQRWSSGSDPVELGLLGGDLHHDLGSPRHDAEQLRAGEGRRLPMDLGTVSLDGGEPRAFVAHLIATARRHSRLWSSRTVVVMNSSFAGPYRLGPRAHPNDGRLDLTDGRLPLRQRQDGRRRALTGSHVPHPQLEQRRGDHLVIDGERLFVLLDGEEVGSARHLEVRCHPDAWVAVV